MNIDDIEEALGLLVRSLIAASVAAIFIGGAVIVWGHAFA